MLEHTKAYSGFAVDDLQKARELQRRVRMRPAGIELARPVCKTTTPSHEAKTRRTANRRLRSHDLALSG
jgi:hypothetical protein